MKAQKNPAKYDAYGVGTPGNLTTTQGALAFMRIADIFAPGHGSPIAVSPADLPSAPIAEMIAEGVPADKGYQFEFEIPGGQRKNIGQCYDQIRSSRSNVILAAQQMFSLSETQIYQALLTADPGAKQALADHFYRLAEACISGDGGW